MYYYFKFVVKDQIRLLCLFQLVSIFIKKFLKFPYEYLDFNI